MVATATATASLAASRAAVPHNCLTSLTSSGVVLRHIHMYEGLAGPGANQSLKEYVSPLGAPIPHITTPQSHTMGAVLRVQAAHSVIRLLRSCMQI